MVDANHVDITYSLPADDIVMTSYLSFFVSTCWCIDAVVSYIIWWNLRQWLNIDKFSFINQI